MAGTGRSGTGRSIRMYLGFALIALVISIAGWRTLTIGLADQALQSDAAAALHWQAAQPWALIRAASDERAQGHHAIARELAQAAIRSNPLDGQGYRELALADQTLHSATSVVDLMRIASLHAPRDRTVHRWLLEFDLVTGNHAQALVHLDFLLRRPAQDHAVYFSALARLLGYPPSQADVIALLNQAPPWRRTFWAWLTRGPTPLATIQSAVIALDGGAQPLLPVERRSWQDRLLREKSWSLAYAYWRDGLPDGEKAQPAPTPIHDGGFEQTPDAQSVFGWQIQPVAGTTISQPAHIPGGGGGRVLQVDFRDRRVPFDHVHQIVLLTPGDYVLHGRQRMRNLRNERGLQWNLTCLDAPYARVAETDRFQGNGDWNDFSTDFTIPAEHCAAQRLSLRLAARVAAEQHIDGTIWFDDMAILDANKIPRQ